MLWDDKKDIQNIHAFSIYAIVEHTLLIVQRDFSVTEHFLIYFSLVHTRLSHNRLLIQACYISINNILLPPLYIKLRLMKNFVKVLDNEVHDFTHLQQIFPNIIEIKLMREIKMDQKIMS